MARGAGHQLHVVSARIHASTLAALVARAEAEQTTRDEIVRRAIRTYVERPAPTDAPRAGAAR